MTISLHQPLDYQRALRVTVRCDDCHAAAPRGEALIGVWLDTELPGDDLPGWESAGHRHRCPTCVARRRCAAAGHLFGPWAPTVEDGRVPLMRHVCRVCGTERAVPAYSVSTVATSVGTTAPTVPLLAS